MTLRSLCAILLGIWSISVIGQQDTSYLNYDLLHWEDVKTSNNVILSTKIIAGTRTERDLEDLPFSVFVITAEEIKEQGYFTLVDALKHLPGVRVSQPGSGLDGETFMMRGLYGNAYSKILVNDIPIKPSVVGAMPIGSQLPIRQAERIEVIYGPAATLYGTDAAAGIINIILKDSDYPTYAQADIETGLQDLTRLNAMFGGKLKLGKKTMKLKMYGGFTSFTDRRVKYDLDSLYNPEVYDRINKANLDPQDLIRYEDRPNYTGTETKPILANLPHQSSYIGFSASIGIFEFHTQRLFRTDHSSIGLSPFAVSYADPQSLIGEEILTSSLILSKKFPKWDFNIKASNLYYAVNPLSSYKYVLPTFGLVTNLYFLNNVQPHSTIDGQNAIDSLYLSGSRYVSNKTTDVSIEAQANFKINEQLSLSAGLQSLSGFGDAIERFRRLPGTVPDRIIQAPSLPSSDAAFSEGSFFVEAYLNFGDFQVIGGAQIFVRSDSLVTNKAQFNPRLGLLYRFTPKFSIRASYSSAFRYPTAFFSGSTYQVNAQDDFISVITGTQSIEPERTISVETGIRFTLDPSIHIDGSLYYTRTNNYINYDFTSGSEPGSILWGYQNDPKSFNRLIGAQLSLKVKNIWPALKMDTDLSLNASKGKERILEIFLNNSGENLLQDIPVIRAQPNFVGHLRISFDAGKHLRIILNNSFMSKSWTRNIFRITAALAENNKDILHNKGYYTLELKAVAKISRQLNAYLSISNLTNVQYGGIDASFDPDVLLYNPQPLRTARLGVNFAFN